MPAISTATGSTYAALSSVRAGGAGSGNAANAFTPDVVDRIRAILSENGISAKVRVGRDDDGRFTAELLATGSGPGAFGTTGDRIASLLNGDTRLADLVASAGSGSAQTNPLGGRTYAECLAAKAEGAKYGLRLTNADGDIAEISEAAWNRYHAAGQTQAIAGVDLTVEEPGPKQSWFNADGTVAANPSVHTRMKSSDLVDPFAMLYSHGALSRYAAGARPDSRTGLPSERAHRDFQRNTINNINNDRRALGKTISGTLSRLGVRLGKDEALSFTVGADGRLAVDRDKLSAKNRSQAGKIEDALNADPDLAHRLKLTAAISGGSKADEASRRAFVMDDLLKQSVGVGLDGIGLQENAWLAVDPATGESMMPEALRPAYERYGTALLSELEYLAANLPEGGVKGFEAAFSFQNGILVDDGAEAKTKGSIADGSLRNHIFGTGDHDRDHPIRLYVSADGTVAYGSEAKAPKPVIVKEPPARAAEEPERPAASDPWPRGRIDGEYLNALTDRQSFVSHGDDFRQLIESHLAKNGGGDVEDYVVMIDSNNEHAVMHKNDIERMEAGVTPEYDSQGIVDASGQLVSALGTELEKAGLSPATDIDLELDDDGKLVLSGESRSTLSGRERAVVDTLLTKWNETLNHSEKEDDPAGVKALRKLKTLLPSDPEVRGKWFPLTVAAKAKAEDAAGNPGA